MRTLLLMLVLLSGCGQDSEQQQAIERYALRDRLNDYQALVDKNAAQLNREQLYNRVLTLWDTPFLELRVPTEYGEAHVIVSGPRDAEPLVLLHGMNTNSTMWYPNAAGLSKHYRVYAIDYILGPGKSKPSGDIDSVEQVTQWYQVVLDKLRLTRINLVGASQGGWLAVNLALADPQRFERVALLSPAQTFTWVELNFDVLFNVLFAINPNREDLHAVVETLSEDVEGISPLYMEQFYHLAKNGDMPPLVTSMQPFSDEQLTQLLMPVMVLVGEQDIINSEQSLQRAKDLLPCAVTDLIADSGHFLSSDNSALINQKLQQFFSASADDSAFAHCPQ